MTSLARPSNRIIAVTKPFGFERRDIDVAWENLTIAEMFERSGIEIPKGCTARVFIDDWLIPEQLWSKVRPKPHHTLTCRVVPKGGGKQGGGDKSALAIVAAVVLAIIVTIVTWGVGTAPLLIAEFGAAGASAIGSAAGAVVGLVGSLVIKALIPPPKQNLGTTGAGSIGAGPQQFTLTGTRNQANPYGPIPKLYGRHRVYPMYGAVAYAEAVGFDQYLRMIFVVGYGPLQISELKIGDTDIDQFEGVEYQIREGWSDDPAIAIYTNDIETEAFNLQIMLVDGWVIRTSKPDADEIAVEMSFPYGLYSWDDNGNGVAATVEFNVQYSPAGQGTWQNCEWLDDPIGLDYNDSAPEPYAHPWRIDGKIYFRGIFSGSKRYSNRFRPAVRGQYDIRFQRVTTDEDPTANKPVTRSFLSVISTIHYRPPITQEGICTIAMRIKASGQLNGVLDSLNCVAESVLPIYDPELEPVWGDDQPTRNPAWHLADLLRGYANNRRVADARVDAAELKDWAEECAEKDWKCDLVFDTRTTVWEAAQLICAAGRASFTPSRDGKYSVVRDRPQTTIVQHFTPRNSWGYSWHMSYGRRVHGLKVRFINPNKNWERDERIVYDDGYDESNATDFEVLELPGKTDAEEIYKFARYFMGQARLRPETHTFSADIENLVCTRGDMIRFAHDTAKLGLGSGRVKSVTTDGSGNAVSVTLDAAVEMVSGADYCIRFRRTEDNGSVLANVIADIGTLYSVTFETPIPSADKPAIGDLWMFGERGYESIELIVTRITPQGDLSAVIECVNAAPELHELDDGGSIPAWSSNISNTQRIPAVPVILDTVSDSSAARVLPGGNSEYGIIVYLAPPSGPPPLAHSYDYQFRPSGGTWGQTHRTNGLTSQIRMAPIADAVAWDLRIRSVSASGMASNWTTVLNHPIEVFLTAPADVENFRTAYIASQLQLVWDTVSDFRYIDYEIRKGPTAESGTVIGIAHGVNMMLALGDDSYWIAARAAPVPGVTIYSNWSELILIGSLLSQNIIATWNEAALGFPGSVTEGVRVEGSNVVNVPTGSFFEILDLFNEVDIFNYGGFGSGYYTIPNGHIVDIGMVAPCAVIISFTAFGFNPAGDFLSEPDFLGQTDFLGSAAGSAIEVYPEIAIAQDDGIYGAWVKYVPGVYVGRYFKARIYLNSLAPDTQAALSGFVFSVDVPDRYEDSSHDLAGAGSTITYTHVFNGAAGGGNGTIPRPQITIVDAAEGDQLLLTSVTTAGFNARVKNAGVGVARTIYYRTQGW